MASGKDAHDKEEIWSSPEKVHVQARPHSYGIKRSSNKRNSMFDEFVSARMKFYRCVSGPYLFSRMIADGNFVLLLAFVHELLFAASNSEACPAIRD